MKAPIFRCPERQGILEDVEPDAAPRFSIPPDRLEPVDYRLLHLLFTGATPRACAHDTERDLAEVTARITRRTFLTVQAEIERGVLDQIVRQGTYEPTTTAKAAAPGAMKRIIDISVRERDPRTRLQANKTVLQYAGVEPPHRVEITTPDRVIEQMTPAELEALADHRVWPARFRDVLRAFLPAPPAIDVTPPPVAAAPAGSDDDDVPPSSFA
jgi:hypothetical protein